MYARTVGRKVKASAAASAEELDGDVPSVGIGKALTVILVLHILAIIAICVGTQWNGDDGSGTSNAIAHDLDNKSANETSATTSNNTGTVYLDVPSSYDLEPDTRSQVPAVQGDAINQRPAVDPVLTVEPRRRPRVIKPKRNPNNDQPMARRENTKYAQYKIQKGDTFYRLAKDFNIKQQEIIDMNPNVDASKMKIGMIVRVPAR